MSWVKYKLGDVCDIARGGSPRPISKFITKEQNGINWIKIADATRSNKYIYKTKEKIKKEGISRSRVVNDGDFLLSNSMSFGRPYIMRITGCIHDGWLVLSNYQKHLDIDFFYYLLSSSVVVNQFENLAQGSTVRNLNKELVSRVEVMIPPLSIQKKIVLKLDKIFTEIDKAIEAAEINIKNAELLFKRYLSEIFESSGKNWKVEKLKDATNKITDGSHNPPRGLDFSSYLMFSSKNINNDNITFKSPRYLSKEDYELENKRTNVSIGDVLLTIVGTIGRCAVVEDPNLKITLQRSVAVIKPKEYLNSRFLMYFFISINKLLNDYAHGVAQKGIYLKQLGNLEISFPKIKEQLSIVIKLDKSTSRVKSLILNYNKKIEELNSLKKSILLQAFNGELFKAA